MAQKRKSSESLGLGDMRRTRYEKMMKEVSVGGGITVCVLVEGSGLRRVARDVASDRLMHGHRKCRGGE